MLADALHAVGMHEAASRYDLAALIVSRRCRQPRQRLRSRRHDGQSGKRHSHAASVPARNSGGWTFALSTIGVSTTWQIQRSADLGCVNGHLESALSHCVRSGAIRRAIAPVRCRRNCAISIRGKAGLSSATARVKVFGNLRKYIAAAGRLMLQIAAHPRIRGPIYRFYKRLPEPIRYRLNIYIEAGTSSDFQRLARNPRAGSALRDCAGASAARNCADFSISNDARAADAERSKQPTQAVQWNVAYFFTRAFRQRCDKSGGFTAGAIAAI